MPDIHVSVAALVTCRPNGCITKSYGSYVLHLGPQLGYSNDVASTAKRVVYAEGDRVLCRNVSESLPAVADSLIIQVIVGSLA